MDERHEEVRQVNDAIMNAIAARLPELDWQFYCECSPNCGEKVVLTVAEYVAVHDRGEPVLAPGHRLTELGNARKAREAARDLRDSAKALRAQAELQQARAQEAQALAPYAIVVNRLGDLL